MAFYGKQFQKQPNLNLADLNITPSHRIFAFKIYLSFQNLREFAHHPVRVRTLMAASNASARVDTSWTQPAPFASTRTSARTRTSAEAQSAGTCMARTSKTQLG